MCGELADRAGVDRRGRRFIPACAGNSSATVGRFGSAAGSSPRVRGTRSRRLRLRRLWRFIPACAGNSFGRCRERDGAPGSSPRVRGTLLLPRLHPVACRFIPACAGNSNSSAKCSGRTSVHPRVCGELSAGSGTRPRRGGSSPRVRGTRTEGIGWDCEPAVHPRVCGELRRYVAAPRNSHGSSPRVRGTRRAASARRGVLRFIPACAGNSAASAWRGSGRPVHPRVCGELGDRGSRGSLRVGSSPRVRGTPGHAMSCTGHGRFIPACAGNSGGRCSTTTTAPVHPRVCGELAADAVADGDLDTVHPRVCGELSRYATAKALPVGSSPRVRGTRQTPSARRLAGGFIPACAGNSSRTPPSAMRTNGSSPRVRGTPAWSPNAVLVRRFIPACAGNSWRRRTGWRRRTVHPRVCGELGRAAVRPGRARRFIPACAGNSKAMPTQNVTVRRFIPACAGNSWRVNQRRGNGAGSSPRVRGTRVRLGVWPRYAPVHPRVCGELTSIICTVSAQNGSSPRVRGTQHRGRCVSHRRRFIPACAGNSFAPLNLMPSSAGSSPRVRGTRQPRSKCPRCEPVHPRVCGELSTPPYDASACNGSSPRVRGTPRAGRPGAARSRFIPACAGNS